ncbi:fatty acyl-AMP ligase [Streptomyces sp. TRM68416]|uniref:fatty acyl-AMP ligase n=1 Tax=Streptomyces sp. TRM68416 TaxID=2758412 RepID=UPI001661D0CD|nr:fatty acyl-AMP ligase [Streptomyces sp. TRM68416]MBD0838222.1 fatty acyl-AMP ligase [Streptomyces sp. TRM68416]
MEAVDPAREAFRFVGARSRDSAPGPAEQTLSYGELDRQARSLAAWVQSQGGTGQRVLLPHCDGPLQVSALLGCLYAGATAVPCPSPLDGGRNVRRLTAIAKDADVSLALADSAVAAELSRLFAGSDLVCLAADRAALPDPGDWRPTAQNDDDLALIQYTSGSVTQVKGVLITQRNLLAGQQAIARALGTSERSVIGGWLPSYHDMGLVGQLLHPLHLGARGVLMPAWSFIRRPLSWLELIAEHGVTLSGGPDFAYDMCVRDVSDEEAEKLDLGSWRVAVNGAEPVREATLRSFAAKFAPAGFRPEAFYPAYGLAEATLLVTGGAPGRPPLSRRVDSAALAAGRLDGTVAGGRSRTLVGVGRPHGAEMRIVDPETRQVLPPGRVGEIWIRGETVAPGYWRRRAETEEFFGAVTSHHEGSFLRSGDLGAVDDSGELFVIGRLKEGVVVNGVDVAPEDIEVSVQGLNPLFGVTAAVTAGPERDRLIVIQEVRETGLLDGELPSLAEAVQTHLDGEFGIPDAMVLLVRLGVVRRTTSGKLQRSAMRGLLRNGGIRPLYPEVPVFEADLSPS